MVKWNPRRLVPPLLVLVGLVVLWEALARSGLWRTNLFPTPESVWATFKDLARSGDLAASLLATVGRLVKGFGMSLVAGVLLALAMTRFPSLRRAVKPYLLGIQSLPGIAWVPFGILWFGYNEDALVFVTVIGSIFAVTIAFTDALALVPLHTLWAARTMGSHGVHLIVRVGLPAALPNLVSGAKQCWAFAWRSLIGAEMVFASSRAIGLGRLLDSGRAYGDSALVMAMMLATLAVGGLVEVILFSTLERRFKRRWGLAS
ncbi:MAG: ABC transporter permease [Thermoplasmatota archaeon]